VVPETCDAIWKYGLDGFSDVFAVEAALMQQTSAAASGRSQGASMPPALEAALRTQVPNGERIVWVGRPSVAHSVARAARAGWQRATILAGGYSLLIGGVATWITGQLAWMALPAVCLITCALGLRAEHQRGVRLADVLDHTAYALTTRHAMVVQSRPTVLLRSLPLSDVEPVRQAGPDPDVSDLVFKPGAGTPPLVFADLADTSDAQELVNRLKAAPEVMEQQFALVAQWAELHARHR
jgi:hypothetical protein